MSGGVLDAIVAAARRSADERAKADGVSRIEREAEGRRPDAAAFRATLMRPGVRIIAECKRRSPSRGILREVYDPAALAAGYEQAGAAAISVLTEPTFFDGALDHLRSVRDVTRLPVLRKDFVVTPFQVLEARAAGADAVLLIAAALDDGSLKQLIAAATSQGLAALVEVHTAEEGPRAADAGAEIVGVNSRNLKTLEVTPVVFDEMAQVIPPGVVKVAESGLRTGEELRRLRALGYHAFLIGERFMTSADSSAALRALIGEAGGGW